MPPPPEVRADIDRIRNLIRVATNMPDDTSGEANSMVYEYLCVAIAGRLEQDIKIVLIKHAEAVSEKRLSAVVAKVCQGFQNPDSRKIVDLLKLFDSAFAEQLEAEWQEDNSDGRVISEMIGVRKQIAHQTSNSRSATRSKIEKYFRSYEAFVNRLSDHFLNGNLRRRHGQ